MTTSIEDGCCGGFYFAKVRKLIFPLTTLALLLVGEVLIAQHQQNNLPWPHQMLSTSGEKVEYDLYIDRQVVSYTGKQRMGIGINGSIPGPVLHFTEGDTAIIRVHNKLKREETSIHWHGLLLPNEEDGVPYVTTAPIKTGQTHTFMFPLKQSGTYWYHSHTMLQEQSGVYGSIVIHPRGGDRNKAMKEHVVMLSDWTDENPHEVMRNLKRGNDWYAIKKNSVQSWGEAMVKGYLRDRAKTEWRRMPSMDISDVYYKRFLINGKPQEEYFDILPGDSIRLRIINGSSSSYQWIQYAGGKMKVVAADGLPVQPVEVDRILIGVAETYDVKVKFPENGMAYELRATAQDNSGSASLYFGDNMVMKARDLPNINYFEMMREMNNMTNMDGMDMGAMKGMKMEGGHGGHDMEKMNMGQDTTMMMKMEKDTSGMAMKMDTASMENMNMDPMT
ncbi:MAG TPA: multicopper oxidase domain-containing protein, partial [Cyclobacteriaceae bacterium]|nr:multicopper oxidase domain-containing protein [Cyclobacteriaceae bacterium]